MRLSSIYPQYDEGYMLLRLYLPSSSKHKWCCALETSNSRHWLLVSIFGWIVRTTWARKRPKSFGFGATATHLQLQHIIFLGHRTASSVTVLLYQMKCDLQKVKPMKSDTQRKEFRHCRQYITTQDKKSDRPATDSYNNYTFKMKNNTNRLYYTAPPVYFHLMLVQNDTVYAIML